MDGGHREVDRLAVLGGNVVRDLQVLDLATLDATEGRGLDLHEVRVRGGERLHLAVVVVVGAVADPAARHRCQLLEPKAVQLADGRLYGRVGALRRRVLDLYSSIRCLCGLDARTGQGEHGQDAGQSAKPGRRPDHKPTPPSTGCTSRRCVRRNGHGTSTSRGGALDRINQSVTLRRPTLVVTRHMHETTTVLSGICPNRVSVCYQPTASPSFRKSDAPW